MVVEFCARLFRVTTPPQAVYSTAPMSPLSLSLLLLAYPPPPPDAGEESADEIVEPADDESLPVVEPEPEPDPEPEPLPPPGNYTVDELDFDPMGKKRQRYNNVGRNLRITGIAINAVGVGLLGTAGVFFILRQRAQTDLRDVAEDPDPTVREAPLADLLAREQTAITLSIAAGATIVVGTTIWAIGRRKGRRASTYSRAAIPMPSAGRSAFGLSWAGRF